MRTSGRSLIGVAAGLLILAETASPARAAISATDVPCVAGVAKAGRTFVTRTLSIRQRCQIVDLEGGRCPGPDAVALQRQVDHLNARIDGACSFGGISIGRRRS
jgi:hypothetical protein